MRPGVSLAELAPASKPAASSAQMTVKSCSRESTVTVRWPASPAEGAEEEDEEDGLVPWARAQNGRNAPARIAAPRTTSPAIRLWRNPQRNRPLTLSLNLQGPVWPVKKAFSNWKVNWSGRLY